VLVEGFGWCLPAEGLSGSAVDRVRDGFNLFGCPSREVGALGEVLAQQFVGIFVGAALPEAVGISEVDRDAVAHREFGVDTPVPVHTPKDPHAPVRSHR